MKTKDWEKQFADKFYDYRKSIFRSASAFSTVRSFIRSLLAKQREEMVKDLDKAKKKLDCCEDCDNVTESVPFIWNKALDDAIEKVRKLK